MATFKIVLIGNNGVGKTSLISRLIYKRFLCNTNSTIGASYSTYTMKIEDQQVKFNIWDTAGQERYRSLVHMYYRNVDYCLIVFDLQRYDVGDIEFWIQEFLSKTSNPNTKFILIGNKADLVYDLEKEQFMGLKELMEKYDVRFFKTSAYDGTNIEPVFEYIGQQLLTMPIEQRIDYNVVSIDDDITYTGSCLGCF